jgi:phospholipid/cholesterol/gamma-HCH transport system substrate-binding protein
VAVGTVESISLVDEQARVVLRLQPQVKVTDDAIVAIKTKVLIGERYVNISPGGSDRIVPPNGKLREVQPPVDLEELISKYVFGKV